MKHALAGFLTVPFLATMTGGAAGAADTPPGEALFWRYCATCHGENGQGAGPTASLLSTPTPDLTRLTRDNGGTFPAGRVVRRIDGRDAVVAHGSPMPIYGAFFDGAPMVVIDTPDGPLAVSAPVAAIAEWLRGLQR